ncbi:hypothetical protein OESDEN_25102 [Oesophagostomum dentatum]|uniref:Uncharacterized protein n=1 Tax=Oesophagostomum dentatum TaxID=61180 RepID=A0A0B1RVR9_OESDE|nr:hypothetical protein OESDEN_25102 [Oesophagostomum dentatum]
MICVKSDVLATFSGLLRSKRDVLIIRMWIRFRLCLMFPANLKELATERLSRFALTWKSTILKDSWRICRAYFLD